MHISSDFSKSSTKKRDSYTLFKSSKSKDVPVEFQDPSGFTSNAKKSEISFVVAATSCLSSITMKAGLSGI